MRDRTLWEGIADDLRREIVGGKYGENGTIPGELALAGQYGASRDTVRKALNALTDEGLITGGRGRLGRQVRHMRLLTFYAARSESAARMAERQKRKVDAWVMDVEDQGGIAGQVISIAIEAARGLTAELLGLPEGTIVAIRRRLRTIDGEPHNLNDTAYPRWISEGTLIEKPDDIPEGVIAYMASLGWVQTSYGDLVEVRMPTRVEAEQLEIPRGIPVAVHYRTGYAEDGRAIKMTRTVWPGDRARLAWEGIPA